MPPKRFISFSVLVFLLTHILQPISASGNPPFVGNIETRLLEIREDSNTQPDLLETLLMVSKHWKPSLDLVPLEEKIKKLLHSARQKLSGLDRHEDIIRAIRTTIHEEAGYRYTDQVDEKGVPINPEELFLHGLLDTHKGYCMNLSLLYLILGQKLGLLVV